MIFTEVTLSYPYVRYKVEVSHFTARKSTAIEWIILEAINKCEQLTNYAGISIALFFEQIFTISDADLLIRPVLISLQDIGAITISGIDDETELDTVAMSNLKLTRTGREMQIQGLLPGMASEETFYIYYDVIAQILKDETNLYKEESTGIRVVDDVDEVEFPEGAIREWLYSIQNDKKRKRLSWFTQTTEIKSVTQLSSEIHWKNIIRKVEIVDGMRWKIAGVEDEVIDEKTLKEADIFLPEELRDLPRLEITNPDDEIKKIVSIDEINELIDDYLQRDDMFCVESKYYKNVKMNQQHKKVRIGIVYGADEFEVENGKKQLIFRVPDSDLKKYGVYFNAKDSVLSGITSVSAGSISRDIAIAYIPNKNETDFPDVIIRLVDKYYQQDSSILFVLYELGLKEKFIEYVDRIILEEQKLADKAKIIELFNEKSRGYYDKNLISAADKERILVNKEYIIEQCKSIKGNDVFEGYRKVQCRS